MSARAIHALRAARGAEGPAELLPPHRTAPPPPERLEAHDGAPPDWEWEREVELDAEHRHADEQFEDDDWSREGASWG